MAAGCIERHRDLSRQAPHALAVARARRVATHALAARGFEPIGSVGHGCRVRRSRQSRGPLPPCSGPEAFSRRNARPGTPNTNRDARSARRLVLGLGAATARRADAAVTAGRSIARRGLSVKPRSAGAHIERPRSRREPPGVRSLVRNGRRPCVFDPGGCSVVTETAPQGAITLVRIWAAPRLRDRCNRRSVPRNRRSPGFVGGPRRKGTG
jgi:hypothetical protein